MMFIKPFKIKSNNQLKTTDRKKICELILLTYPCLSEDIQTLFPKKEAVTMMKITTHNDQPCKVYCVSGIPMFFELEKSTQLFPTIYTLWRYPNLLYSFTLYTEALTKLVTGASLMETDFVHSSNLYRLQKTLVHKPVSLNTTDNKAPIAVGISTGDNICIEIYHMMDDMLSQMGKQQTRPNLEPPNINDNELFLTKDNRSDSRSDNTSDSRFENIRPLSDLMDELKFADNCEDFAEIDYLSEEHLNELEEMEELEENNIHQTYELSEYADPKDEMDDLLIYCFLKACKTTLKPANLPILSSNFFKNHLLPVCPPDKTIDIKKSQYKKLSVFLADMKAKGLINTSITKGVESIISVQFNHKLLKDLTINEEEIQSQGSATNKINSQTNYNNFTYKVNSSVYPILLQFGYEKGDTLGKAEIKQCFTKYLIQERLLNGEFTYLNSQLREIFKLPLTSTVMNVDDAINRFMKSMNCRPELIFMRVVMRNKGKKATLVNNLEIFGINSKDFSRECQSIGASATVTLDPGRNTPCVFIQGNQILYIYKLLTEKYGIKQQHIRGLEFAPKKLASKKSNPKRKK